MLTFKSVYSNESIRRTPQSRRHRLLEIPTVSVSADFSVLFQFNSKVNFWRKFLVICSKFNPTRKCFVSRIAQRRIPFFWINVIPKREFQLLIEGLHYRKNKYRRIFKISRVPISDVKDWRSKCLKKNIVVCESDQKWNVTLCSIFAAADTETTGISSSVCLRDCDVVLINALECNDFECQEMNLKWDESLSTYFHSPFALLAHCAKNSPNPM